MPMLGTPARTKDIYPYVIRSRILESHLGINAIYYLKRTHAPMKMALPWGTLPQSTWKE